MTMTTLFRLIKNKWPTIILMGIFVASIFFWSAMLFSGSFESKSDILVVQNQEGFVDYYALSKSAEYLSKVLTESIYSESFLEEMKKTKVINIDSVLPMEKSDRLKKWKKMVKIKRKTDTGILSIEVLGDDSNQVKKISQGLLTVVTEKGHLFLGRGQNLGIKVLSGPIIEKRLGAEEVSLICLGGLLMGLFFSSMFFYYWEDNKNKQKNNFLVKDLNKKSINFLKGKQFNEIIEESEKNDQNSLKVDKNFSSDNMDTQVKENEEKENYKNKKLSDKEIEISLDQLLKYGSQKN